MPYPSLPAKSSSGVHDETTFYKNLISTALKVGFQAIDPERLTKSKVVLESNRFSIESSSFSLDRINNIFIVGGGKASYLVAKALYTIFKGKIKQGIVNIPKKQITLLSSSFNYSKNETKNIPIAFHPANHPIPDEQTIAGTKKQVSLLQTLTEKDLVFILITGGASSLLELPRKELSLDDLKKTHNILINSNLPINKINIVRKHLSLIKGGQLPSYTKAQVIGLYISDVPTDDLGVIGSGPTIPCSSSYKDSLLILNKAGIFNLLPKSVRELIKHGSELEEIQTSNLQSSFPQVDNFLLGSNRELLHSMQAVLSDSIRTTVCDENFTGELADISNFLRQYVSFPYVSLPRCFLWGGESTVPDLNVNDEFSANLDVGTGTGGRNQELILHFLLTVLDQSPLGNVILVCLGTDGIDGNSNNMGAYFDTNYFEKNQVLLERMRKKLTEGLRNHDSANVLPTDLVLTTGPTLTNVSDLILLLLF